MFSDGFICQKDIQNKTSTLSTKHYKQKKSNKLNVDVTSLKHQSKTCVQDVFRLSRRPRWTARVTRSVWPRSLAFSVHRSNRPDQSDPSVQ